MSSVLKSKFTAFEFRRTSTFYVVPLVLYYHFNFVFRDVEAPSPTIFETPYYFKFVFRDVGAPSPTKSEIRYYFNFVFRDVGAPSLRYLKPRQNTFVKALFRVAI